jgi:hypothetical protein
MSVTATVGLRTPCLPLSEHLDLVVERWFRLHRRELGGWNVSLVVGPRHERVVAMRLSPQSDLVTDIPWNALRRLAAAIIEHEPAIKHVVPDIVSRSAPQVA